MSTTTSLPPVLQSDLQQLLNFEKTHGTNPAKWGATDLYEFANDVKNLVQALAQSGEGHSDIYKDLAKYKAFGEDNTTIYQAAINFLNGGSYEDMVNDVENLNAICGSTFIEDDINELLNQ